MAQALTTTAQLLAHCKTMARRPGIDVSMEDEDWYALLSAAQDYWYTNFCLHFPEVLYGDPALMSTADSGKTYTFPSSVYPAGAIEIRASRTGALLKPGVEWDSTADFVPEGNLIRIPSNKTRTFDDGPYARYVAFPDEISATQEPTLTPDWARKLIADRALVMWARRGGHRNDAPFRAEMQANWTGDPEIAGDGGIMAAIKTMYYGRGAAAMSFQGSPFSWRIVPG